MVNNPFDAQANKIIKEYQQEIKKETGYCADPNLPKWKNVQNYILQMPVAQLTLINNKAYHNKALKSTPPIGSKSVLGLGLKFCVKHPRPNHKIQGNLDRLKRDIRRSIIINNNKKEEEEPEEPPAPYIKLFHKPSDWNPDNSGDNNIEAALTAFERDIKRHRKRFMKATVSNLRPSQYKIIKKLQNNDNIITIEADKNLGLVVYDRDEYMKRAISEHLGNTDVYERIETNKALKMKDTTALHVRTWIQKWYRKGQLNDTEKNWLMENCNKKYTANLPRFRMTGKIHKNPDKMRPIVCCAGTLLNDVSIWLDYQLKKLLHLLPCYLKDSNHILQQLQQLGQLPPSAKLFTADASSMYTNIEFDHAIDALTYWFKGLATYEKLPADFPTEAVLEALEIVMKKNLFEWGNMYFLQKKGTAMGTSSACLWATIYYAIHEIDTLLPVWAEQLKLLKRFIDDMFGVWIPDPDSPHTPTEQWEEFKLDLPFGELTWDDIEIGNRVHFLDLWIYIDSNHRICHKTYQKSINIYQYLPPHSAHPEHQMAGIIYGLMRTYKLQNPNQSDYEEIINLLRERHIARGWDRATMNRFIREASHKLAENPPQLVEPDLTPEEPDTSGYNRSGFILHWEHHPNDIPRHLIRKLYNKHLAGILMDNLGYNQLTVAYSRPKNLRELLTKAKLYEVPGLEANTYYDNRGSFT